MNLIDLGAAALSLITIVLTIGSFWFWGVFFQKVKEGKSPVPLRFRWRPVRVPRFPLILTLALLGMYFLGMKSAGAGEKLTPDHIRLLVLGNLVEGVIVLGILLPATLLGTRHRAQRVRLGLRTDHLGQQFKEGLLGLLSVVIPMGIVLVLTSPIRSAETEHPFLQLLRENGSSYELLIVAVSAIVFAPLKEELMFRVVLQSWFQEFCPPGLAVALSSILFAAIHGFPDSLALLPLAVTLGYLYQRRSSYLSVVTLHALFNAYNVLGAVVGDRSL